MPAHLSVARIVSEFASEMALIPFLWLAVLRWRGRDLGAAWRWIAGVFAVSWIADTAALWVSPWLVGAVYPVSQTAIVGAVFLSRKEALWLVSTLVIIGIVDIWWHGITGPDIMLRTAAWLSIVGILWRLRQLKRLRITLLVAFGLGWLAWLGYVINPGWWSWGVYQSVRLAGIVLFCWATMKPVPRFTITAGN